MELIERAIEFFKNNPDIQPPDRDHAKQAVIDAVALGKCDTIKIEEANGDASLFWSAYQQSKPIEEKTNEETPI